MKPLKSIAILSMACLVINACEQPVKFNEPQPAGKSNLSHFPNSLTGIYKSSDDNYFVEVKTKMIIKKQSTEVVISKAEVDSSKELHLKGNILVDSGNNFSFKVNLINDTLHGTINLTDTFFILNNENVLRKFRGHYFINTKHDDGGYDVKMITYEKGGHLTISEIQKDEIENLKSVTEIAEPSDSTLTSDYQFKPTKKEFKKFVNDMHGFRNSEEYLKVK